MRVSGQNVDVDSDKMTDRVLVTEYAEQRQSYFKVEQTSAMKGRERRTHNRKEKRKIKCLSQRTDLRETQSNRVTKRLLPKPS